MCKIIHGWPDSFDLRSEPDIHDVIHRFIHEHLQALKAYDEQRKAWIAENLPADYTITYLFHDHSLRVAEDMRKTVLYLGLGEACAHHMHLAMLAHDFGKMALPVSLWDMVEKPEENIRRARRSHTELGAEMTREALDIDHPFIDLMIDIMAQHHEHMDGSGYLGLKAADLSLPVRLAAIIESFDGYSVPRPHFGDRDVSPAGVLKRMREEKGPALFDIELLEAFAQIKLMDYNQTHQN